MNTWFISDLHLQDVFERNGLTLLRFLFKLNEEPKSNRLVLLGDIFDVWVSDGQVFQNQFKPIINEIIKLQKNGGEVYYFEGNHDVHIKKFWAKHGIKVFNQAAEFSFGHLKIRAEHGDYINPNDVQYLKWLSMMRNPIMEFLAHLLPGFFWFSIARRYSQKSRKKTSSYAELNSNRIREMIREYAQTQYHKSQFDLIVTGHMHVSDFFTFERDGKKIYSVNLGTWLEKPIALLISESGELKTMHLEQ